MLTVLMATYNGSGTLSIVLDAYCTLLSPRGGWKLIIVDNGSTDNTREVIGAFRQRLPLTYLHELTKGKNAALNTGLGHTEGDLIVFSDDDVIPKPDWLMQFRTVADAQPSFSFFGGTIVPRWEMAPEPWIINWVPLVPTYGLTEPTWEEGPVTPRRVFGGNSAYRRIIFESGYKFNPAIGPSGTSYAMGSEYELNVRLMNAGLTSWHCKGAIVEHIIRKAQMNTHWVLRRAFRSGRGFYHVDIKDMLKSPRLVFGMPRYILRECVTQAVSVANAKVNGDERNVFLERWKLNYLIGQAYEAWVVHNRTRRSHSRSLSTTRDFRPEPTVLSTKMIDGENERRARNVY